MPQHIKIDPRNALPCRNSKFIYGAHKQQFLPKNFVDKVPSHRSFQNHSNDKNLREKNIQMICKKEKRLQDMKILLKEEGF